MKSYDVIVIGTGSGNIILEAAQAQGLTCAQIEKGKFGGTCLTRGCIPTKVLVTAADRLYEIKEAAHLGIHTNEPVIDWARISERVWQKIDESNDLRQTYLNDPTLDVYEGKASFIDDHRLIVTSPVGTVSEELTAKKIFIGTGGVTNIPKMEGLSEVPYLTSETFFGDDWPNHPYDDIIVVGGGAIGCEFAHIFRAFGAKVTLVQHNVRLLPKADEDLSASILNNLQLDGIEVLLNKETPSVRREGDRIYLDVEDRETGVIDTVESRYLFICPGIRPTTEALGLANTNIETDKRGWIVTNECLETSVPGVYAFGDVNGRQQFRHKANYEADILAHNHFKASSPDEWRWARYDLVPAVTYTHPEVAQVGLTEAQAREKGHRVQVAVNTYAATAKGFALGFEPSDKRQNYAKLIIDQDTDDILGMHAIGPFASTLIQPFLNLMNAGATGLVPINEHIASEELKDLRARDTIRLLSPHKEQTVRETMVPHPSLSEVGIWTYYNLEQYK